MVSPVLTTDDAVRLRVVASRCNVGNRYGDMGELHFLLLQNDPYEKHWHYDMNGNKTYAMLKKNNPFSRFDGPKEAASSSGEKQWKHSLGDAIMVLLAQMAGSMVAGCMVVWLVLLLRT